MVDGKSGELFHRRKNPQNSISAKFRGGKFLGHLSTTLWLQETELPWLIRIETLGLETKNCRLRIVEISPRVKRSEQTRLRQFPSRKSWKTRFLWAYKKIPNVDPDPAGQNQNGSMRIRIRNTNWNKEEVIKKRRQKLPDTRKQKNLTMETLHVPLWSTGTPRNRVPGQCCASGMFIPDNGSWFLTIPDPTTAKKGGKIRCPAFVAINITKLTII